MHFFITIVRAVLLAMFMCAATAAEQPVTAGHVSHNSSSYFHKYYSGKIADKYAFTMDLKNLNGVLSGTYRYAGKQNGFDLQGSIDASNSFTMEEVTELAKHTGVFTGAVGENKISGIWRSTDGTKQWPFVANQTSEIKIESKKEILTKAIGHYFLQTITGSGGPNEMWDTWLVKGKWKSNRSGNSGGMRQADSIKLTQADILMLDSMAIEVNSDLGTQLLVGGKSIISIPYRERGMQLHMTNLDNAVVQDQLKIFSPGTEVIDEQLYLLAQDGIDYSNVISGNFEATVNNIVIVSYSIVTDSFKVSFAYDTCCSVSTFTFTRRPAP